ncbi:MAG: hypothetical protein ACI4S3_10325 [Candidatus Gastranaerophilaceae bacterium]
MVDINVNKNQGLISAIKTQLNAEQIDTSKCNASIWSQVLEQVTIENEQNKKEGKELIYTKGNDMNGDGHSNFVIFEGVIKFSQKLWDNICRIVKGEIASTKPSTSKPQNNQAVEYTPTNTATSGVDKIEKNNFIDELNEVEQVEPKAELKNNIEKAQKVLIEQLQNFTEQDLQTLGITPAKRDRLLKYLENIIYDNTHDSMQGKGIWIVVSNNCADSDNLANMITMLMHEANHCDENFITKYPEYADKNSICYVEGRDSNSDTIMVNTKAEERACETLGLLTTAILHKKGILEDYKRNDPAYKHSVSEYIDSEGKPTKALKEDIDNWVSSYTNYPEDMKGNITVEHMRNKDVKDVPSSYNRLQIQAGDVIVVKQDDGTTKQVTLGQNGAILSPVDSAPIFQLVNAEFGGRIIFDSLQPTEDEYRLLESRTKQSEKPDFNNYQSVSIMRNGKEIYTAKLY